MDDDSEESSKRFLLAMSCKTEPPEEPMDEFNDKEVGSKDQDGDMIEATGPTDEVNFGAKDQNGEMEATQGLMDEVNHEEPEGNHQKDVEEGTEGPMNEVNNEVEMIDQDGKVMVVDSNIKIEEGTYDIAYVILDDDANETNDSTNQDTDLQDSSFTKDSETSSSLIADLPNEESSEQPQNFELVFPYGHNFLLNKEVVTPQGPLQLNGASDNGEQYEDYSQWFSRVSRACSEAPRGRPASARVRGGSKRGRGVTFLLPADDAGPGTAATPAPTRNRPRPLRFATRHAKERACVARAAAERRAKACAEHSARSTKTRAARARTVTATDPTATPTTDLTATPTTDLTATPTTDLTATPTTNLTATHTTDPIATPATDPTAAINPADDCATTRPAPVRGNFLARNSTLLKTNLNFCEFGGKTTHVYSDHDHLTAVKSRAFSLATRTAADRRRAKACVARAGTALIRSIIAGDTPADDTSAAISPADDLSASHFCECGDKPTHVCITHDHLTIVSDIVNSRELAKDNPESEATTEKSNEADIIAFKSLIRAGNALLHDEGKIDWWTMRTFQAVRETFDAAPTGSVASHATIYDAFRGYWDDEVLNHIVTETNGFANSPLRPREFKSQWYDTTKHEILALFAFWIMLGIIKVPTIKACFSSDPLLKMNIFRAIFTRSRYEQLVTALHFGKKSNTPKECRLHCFGPVLDHLNAKFQSNFTPAQNVSIDDSLLLLKSTNSSQYSTKRFAQLGSTFELSDSATGYLWSFVVYTGENTSKMTERKSRNLITTIVLKLMRPLLNKGHTLFMGSWLNSPALARFLKICKTDCVGTIDASSTGFPSFLKAAPTSPGKYVARHSNELCILAWHDERKEYFISTYHGIIIREVAKTNADQRSRSWAPQLVIDYNQNMKEADQKDQSLEPYMTAKKFTKWHIRFLKRMLSRSVLNAQILVESTRKMKADNLATRLQLVDSILKNHLSLCPAAKDNAKPVPNVPQSRDNGTYFTNGNNNFANYDDCTIGANCINGNICTSGTNGILFGHWPVRVTQKAPSGDVATLSPEAPDDDVATVTLEASNGDVARVSLCAACLRRGNYTGTDYKCEQCDVPLCISCFKDFHVKSD